MLKDILFAELGIEDKFTLDGIDYVKVSHDEKYFNCHCKEKGAVILPLDTIVQVDVEDTEIWIESNENSSE